MTAPVPEGWARDGLGPVVPAAGPAPGRRTWKPDGTMGPWEGETCWRTVHGDATLCWRRGEPVRAFAVAHASDGPLAEVEAFPRRDGVWRRPTAEGYAVGTLDVRDDGIAFVDGPVPPFAPRRMPGDGEPPDLEAELGRDTDFLGLVRDDAFAAAVCDGLRNRDLVRSDAPDRPWLMSYGRIAGMVADMRGRGEAYTDWYPYPRDTTPAAVAAFEAVVARLGWRDLDSDDAALHARLLADLMAEVDARPAGPCPDWASRFGTPAGNEPYERMAKAAVEGRITRDEWARVVDLHATVMDAILDGG